MVDWGLVVSRQDCQDGLGTGVWERAEMEIGSDS